MKVNEVGKEQMIEKINEKEDGRKRKRIME
jgi:hypothetical protein